MHPSSQVQCTAVSARKRTASELVPSEATPLDALAQTHRAYKRHQPAHDGSSRVVHRPGKRYTNVSALLQMLRDNKGKFLVEPYAPTPLSGSDSYQLECTASASKNTIGTIVNLRGKLGDTTPDSLVCPWMVCCDVPSRAILIDDVSVEQVADEDTVVLRLDLSVPMTITMLWHNQDNGDRQEVNSSVSQLRVRLTQEKPTDCWLKLLERQLNEVGVHYVEWVCAPDPLHHGLNNLTFSFMFRLHFRG